MIKSPSSLSATLATAVLGMALLLPTVANASCRAVGDSWVTGDCSPRSSTCEKHVVTGYGYYGNDPALPLLTVARYKRNQSGWYFVRYYSIRC